MSINYNLQIETDLNPEDSLKLLRSSGFQETGDCELSGYGLIIKAQKTDKVSQELIEESFGFKPQLQISFWLQSHYQDVTNRNRVQIKSVMQLLEKISGDAVFLFEYDKAILRKKSEKLILNQLSFKKDDERLKEVKIPYTVELLPSL